MPFTTTKAKAKVGNKLFEGTVSAVELTRTMLDAPQKQLDGLELGAVKRGPDDIPTTISDEVYDLCIRA
jgi:hypothetical protein